jgi:hypothetical protein
VGSDLFINIFQKPRVLRLFFQAPRDCGTVYNKLRGFFANFMRILFFWNYFSNGKIRELGPLCGGPVERSGPRWTGRQHGLLRGDASQAHGAWGAMGLESSPVKAIEEEGDAVEPMRGSPEHERRRKTHNVRVLERGRELESAVERCSEGRG